MTVDFDLVSFFMRTEYPWIRQATIDAFAVGAYDSFIHFCKMYSLTDEGSLGVRLAPMISGPHCGDFGPREGTNKRSICFRVFLCVRVCLCVCVLSLSFFFYYLL